MSEEREELLERAVFGKEVEAFLGSNVGRYVLAKANAQAARAVDAFKNVDPHNSGAVQKLQNDIKVAENIMEWLTDAVSQGLQAIDIIDSPD
ncbi:MAG: hypothetical protein JWR07_1917 [Nevskia sp.]|nr:hypothetical protein [Nevskia sp.]